MWNISNLHHHKTDRHVLTPSRNHCVAKWYKSDVSNRTSKYPQQLRSICIQHHIINALELSSLPPPPPPPPQNKNYEKLFILVISLVEKIGRTVKQSSTWKLAQFSPMSGSHSWELWSLSHVAVLLLLFVCHVHSGLHQYSWFSHISSTVANRYRKSTSLLKRSVSITLIS